MNPYIRWRNTFINKHFRFLARFVGKALSEYSMVQDKDKILVGISGGKDSLSCLHLLDYHRSKAPFRFEIIACHVDLGFSQFLKEGLKDHLERFGFSYVFKEEPLLKEKESGSFGCFWCSWNRRKILFKTCKEFGCNKLALAHHLDDIIQTTLLNLVFHGEVSTCPPSLEFFGGDLKLIRPLCLVEEEDLRRFARNLGLPFSDYKCPYKDNVQRDYIKDFIEKLSKDYPYIKANIFRSLRRIREGYLV